MNNKLVFGIFTAALLGLGPAAMAGGLAGAGEQAGTYTFTVLRDGAPIGKHQFTFHKRGERLEIAAETELKVSFAMIPVFHFEHQRHEVWDQGQPVLINAKTDNDGEAFDISVRPNGHGYLRTVNGRVDHFDPSTKVLAFWNKDTTRYSSFFSVVEDKVFDVSFANLGWERMTVAGEEMDVEHYRMMGDERRDLWFDQGGRVAKVKFRRHGSDIEYLRDQVDARPAD